MWTLMKSLGARRMALEQAPALGASFVVAELFYRFHSFTLECLAFLGTWLALDAVLAALGWGGPRVRVPARPLDGA
jgi:hypothetical protein